MQRLMSALSLCLLLLLAGCAGTGSSREDAIELVPGSPKDVLTAGHRYFMFTLNTPARVVLESQTFPGDSAVSPAGQLLAANGELIERDWDSGRNGNFRIERQLEPGIWYLHVTTPHASPASYGSMESDYRYTVLLRVDRNP